MLSPWAACDRGGAWGGTTTDGDEANSLSWNNENKKNAKYLVFILESRN